MSKNPNKDKGSRWERDAVELLNQGYPGAWKRIAMSGALGTLLEMPLLQGDVMGDYPFLPAIHFLGECKVGYGGTEMTIHKAWFDKIRQAAEACYAQPLVLLKFERARSGVRHVVCVDFAVWGVLMEEMEAMHDEILALRAKLHEHEPVAGGGS